MLSAKRKKENREQEAKSCIQAKVEDCCDHKLDPNLSIMELVIELYDRLEEFEAKQICDGISSKEIVENMFLDCPLISWALADWLDDNCGASAIGNEHITYLLSRFHDLAKRFGTGMFGNFADDIAAHCPA